MSTPLTGTKCAWGGVLLCIGNFARAQACAQVRAFIL